jgi:hypothetical protein
MQEVVFDRLSSNNIDGWFSPGYKIGVLHKIHASSSVRVSIAALGALFNSLFDYFGFCAVFRQNIVQCRDEEIGVGLCEDEWRLDLQHVMVGAIGT